MWLPADERKLIVYYYQAIQVPGGSFESRDDVNEINALKRAPSKKVKCISDDDRRLWEYTWHIKETLQQRGLVKITRRSLMDFDIELTLDGYDLGRRYSSWWTRSGLWFSEHRNHWIMLILGLIGGILGALIVNFLSGSDC